MPISDAIHERAADLGLTMSEVARRAKLHPASLRRVLRAPHRAKVDTWQRIAAALGWRLVLLGEDGEHHEVDLGCEK